MKTQRSTKIIVSFSLLFFIASVAAFVLFSSHVQAEKERSLALSTESAQARSRQEALTALTMVLEETRVEREGLITRILNEEEVINFLSLIESIGREQKVSLKTNSLSVEPIDEVFETLVINITVGGSYDSVMRVLSLIEHLPYQSSVENVKVARDGEAGIVDTWTSTYEVRVTKFTNHES